MFRRFRAALALLATAAAPAAAQVDLTVQGFVPLYGVSYTTFMVTGAGTFDIWTTAVTYPAGYTPFDPVLYLFSGLGTGGTLVSMDDDGCGIFSPQCGSAAVGGNALLDNIFLGVGSYTVAVGDYPISEQEARAGSTLYDPNLLYLFGDFALRISSLGEFLGDATPGDATLDATSTVPEPATMTLLATGLLGMAAARRKRRTG